MAGQIYPLAPFRSETWVIKCVFGFYLLYYFTALNVLGGDRKSYTFVLFFFVLIFFIIFDLLLL